MYEKILIALLKEERKTTSAVMTLRGESDPNVGHVIKSGEIFCQTGNGVRDDVARSIVGEGLNRTFSSDRAARSSGRLFKDQRIRDVLDPITYWSIVYISLFMNDIYVRVYELQQRPIAIVLISYIELGTVVYKIL